MLGLTDYQAEFYVCAPFLQPRALEPIASICAAMPEEGSPRLQGCCN